MNESVQVIVTKYKNRAKQNIPNYTRLVIARVLVSYLTCEHILLKYITKLQVALVCIKLQYYNNYTTLLSFYLRLRFFSSFFFCFVPFLPFWFDSQLWQVLNAMKKFEPLCKPLKNLNTTFISLNPGLKILIFKQVRIIFLLLFFLLLFSLLFPVIAFPFHSTISLSSLPLAHFFLSYVLVTISITLLLLSLTLFLAYFELRVLGLS